MNLMGVGLLEIVVILLVAFLVLGPNRSIGMARTAGRLIHTLRRNFNDLAEAINLEEKNQSNPGPPPGVPTDQGRENPPKAGNE